MLEGVFPLEELRERFPDAKEFTLHGANHVPLLEQTQLDKLLVIGMQQWDRLVEWGPDKIDPGALLKYTNKGGVNVVKFISDTIRRPLIEDLVYHRFTVERDHQEIIVAEYFLVVTYPNDLHFVYLNLANPDEPLPQEKRKWKFHHYEGLGLMRPIMNNVIETGRQEGYRALTMAPSTPALRDYFIKEFGFEYSDTNTGRAGQKTDLLGTPVEITYKDYS